MNIRRGDIIWVEFRSGNGHIQRGRRPCVVVSTDRANRCSHIINVIPGTTNLERKDNPVHLIMKRSDIRGFIGKDTMLLTEQLTAVDKDQVLTKAGSVSTETISRIDALLLKQLGMDKEDVNE